MEKQDSNVFVFNRHERCMYVIDTIYCGLCVCKIRVERVNVMANGIIVSLVYEEEEFTYSCRLL